ncbi:MAG: hypothetical protein EBU90_31495, partial [Proteobacteria bacterium]|nr:hypothetical protein [Pseudomonadota bacterium]
KITSVDFGFGDYQSAMFGLSVEFKFDECCCVGDFVSGFWAYGLIDCSEHAKWTEEERALQMVKMCKTVCQILQDAKCESVNDLLNKPVEIVSEGFGGCLLSWRILTEVL